MRPSYDHRSTFRILKGGKISLIVSALIAGSTMSFAAPSGGVVTGGSALIDQSGSVTNIIQSTQRAAINWQAFSIAANETVNFIQPNASSVTLNRVIGNESSLIEGALNANGQVWILNSNGVLFGRDASINTAGLVASTMNISDADFMAGNTTFQSTGSIGSVINMGTIHITDGGYAAFLGKEAINQGLIQATKGTVLLAGSDKITLNFNGDSLVGITIDQGTLDALIENRGAIIADGGSIYLTTQAADKLLNGVVNNTGILEADTLNDITGHIEVYAHGGTAAIGGTLKAEGGFIETSASELSITQGTVVNAANWLIDPVNVTIDAALASTLEGQLATGNATVTTGAAGSDAGDINVNAAINWNLNTLNLVADRDININALVNATGSAGLAMTGNVKVGFNPGEAAGFSGRVDMAAGTTLSINAIPYTIINTLGAEGSLSGADLQGMNGALGGHYALGSNIDASATAAWNAGDGFLPVGNYPDSFTGSFEGLGHTITGLTINRPADDLIGLFGYTIGSALRNTGLIGSSITGAGYTGALAGYSSSGTISNSYMGGSVNGADQVGGLIGGIDGSTVVDSYATGSVSGANLIGGLIGESLGSVARSYATGTVTGTGYFVGGLNGYTDTSTISDSHATGAVSGGWYVGGLSGALDGGIAINSYATGAVTGSDATGMTGGLIGAHGGTLSNTYATGAVNGTNNVGGLTGYSDVGSTITNSYATGAVSGSGTNIGGLVGGNGGTTVTASFWDIASSGQNVSAGGTGLSTANMKNTKTFYDAGWDFDTIWGRDTDNVLNSGYLALKALHPDFAFKTVLAMNVTPSKVYDGSALITPTLNRSELVNTVSVNGAVNVGTYATASLSDFDFTFNDGKVLNDFEILLYSSATMAITPKALSISGITAENKVYDGTTAATVSTAAATLSGLITGDDLTLSSTGAFSDANVGTGKTVNLTNNFGGADLNNYTISNQLATTADITAVPTESQSTTTADTSQEIDQIVTTIINTSETTETQIVSNTTVPTLSNTQNTPITLLDGGVNLPEGVEEEDN